MKLLAAFFAGLTLGYFIGHHGTVPNPFTSDEGAVVHCTSDCISWDFDPNLAYWAPAAFHNITWSTL